MPNLEAAAELLSATDSASESVDTAAPPVGAADSGTEPVVEAPPATAPATPNARLERLQAARAKRQAERTELARERARVTEEQQAWKAKLRTDPIAALKEINSDPLEAYQAIAQAAAAEDTPEARAKKEIEAIDARLKAAEARESAARRESLVTQFLAETGKLEALTDFYDDAELVELGDIAANKLVSEGKAVTIQSIVQRVHEDHVRRAKRAAERSAKRTPATPPPTSPPTQSPVVTQATEPTAIGSNLTSEAASSRPVRLTRKERLERAEEVIQATGRRSK